MTIKLFFSITSAGIVGPYVQHVMSLLIILAAISVVLLITYGGVLYTTSTGRPEQLGHAKVILKNALIGLVIVIGAGTLTSILSHAYTGSNIVASGKLPALQPLATQTSSNGLVDVLIGAITGLFKNLIESAAQPFLTGLNYFTHATPLMASNPGVFHLWLVITGIADSLFVLVIALLGFHMMSYATFGFEEIEIKQLFPRIGLIFLLINTSIFAIDAVIGLSNILIASLDIAFSSQSVWDSLLSVVNQDAVLGLAALFIMVAFLILAVVLMIYYVLRLVVLYVGAVLSPLALLMWLVPPFKDLVETAGKTYAATIFILFIHVVILELAASIFSGMLAASPDHVLNPLMSLIVGLATLLALLKTQGVMSQLSYASLGPRTASKLGGQLGNIITYYGGKSVRSAAGHIGGRRGYLAPASTSSVIQMAPNSTATSKVGSGDQHK